MERGTRSGGRGGAHVHLALHIEPDDDTAVALPARASLLLGSLPRAMT